MKNILLNYIFIRNKTFFYDKVVDDVIGVIPKDIQEPAFEVMAQYKTTLDKWLIWFSWNIQKKMNTDAAISSEGLKGSLLVLKVLQTKVARTKVKYTEMEKLEEEEKPTEGVKNFLEGMKKLGETTTKQ